jgi:hypothetical protein
LSNPDLAASTVTEKDKTHLLESREEVLLNTIWRMLTVRGYINEHHNLTAWGKVLHATLCALPQVSPENITTLLELEEAAIMAVELLRLGVLSSREMFSTYGGAPYSKDETINRNTLLVSRVACLASFSHKPIGYTGPLSRHFLGYASMINAVRESLRDTTEACAINLLFMGDADRKRSDYGDLGFE